MTQSSKYSCQELVPALKTVLCMGKQKEDDRNYILQNSWTQQLIYLEVLKVLVVHILSTSKSKLVKFRFLPSCTQKLGLLFFKVNRILIQSAQLTWHYLLLVIILFFHLLNRCCTNQFSHFSGSSLSIRTDMIPFALSICHPAVIFILLRNTT